MRRIRMVATLVLCAACAEQPSAPLSPAATSPLRTDLAGTAVTAVDLSNGSGLEGEADVLSRTGVILGKLNGRGWWQSPSPVFTRLDDGGLTRGNRNSDVGAQDEVLLSTNGGAPWTRVTLQKPAGAKAVLARDLNDARVVVGSTLGTVYALRWEDPYSAPTRLPVPALQYPVNQVSAYAINTSGVIVGSVYEQTGRNSTRYEALVWSGAGVRTLPWAPGATSQRATNVNDAGVISGYVDANQTSYPARWTPRADGGYDVAVLDLPASRDNLYTGIDACGRISGGSDRGAFVWDGISAPLILPQVAGSQNAGAAYDIDAAGNVVGKSAAGTTKGRLLMRPTLWTGLPACTP